MELADYNNRQAAAAHRLRKKKLLRTAQRNLQAFGCPDLIRAHAADETPLEYAERMMGSNPPLRIRVRRFAFLSIDGFSFGPRSDRFNSWPAIGALAGVVVDGRVDVLAWLGRLQLHLSRPADKFDGPDASAPLLLETP